MSTTEDTNATRRGSGSNDLLGPLPEHLEIALATLLERQFELGFLSARNPRPSQAQCRPAADAIRAVCAALGQAITDERNRCDWAEDCARVLLKLKDTLAERGARPETPEKAALWDEAWHMYTRMLTWANPGPNAELTGLRR